MCTACTAAGEVQQRLPGVRPRGDALCHGAGEQLCRLARLSCRVPPPRCLHAFRNEPLPCFPAPPPTAHCRHTAAPPCPPPFFAPPARSHLLSRLPHLPPSLPPVLPPASPHLPPSLPSPPPLQTYNYGVDSYDLGEGFGHFGIATPDAYKMVEAVKAKGEACGCGCGCGVAWRGVVGFGVMCRGVAWRGMAGCGVVWCIVVLGREVGRAGICAMRRRAPDPQHSIKRLSSQPTTIHKPLQHTNPPACLPTTRPQTLRAQAAA